MDKAGASKLSTRRSNAVLVKPPQPTTKRGQDTRERLKLSLNILLQTRSYHEIGIRDITKKADLPIGVFYRYFQGKADITQEVLEEILSKFVSKVVGRSKGGKEITAIHYANQCMVALYSENPGAMRCLVEVRERGTPFENMWRRLTLDWNLRIAASIKNQFPGSDEDGATYVALAYGLAGTVDNFLFEYYVQKNSTLRVAYPYDEAVAGFLTTLWYRTLYLKNPPAKFNELRPELSLFRIIKAEKSDTNARNMKIAEVKSPSPT